MKIKKKTLVLGLTAFVIIFVSALFVVQNSENEFYTLSEIRNEYVNLDDSKVASVGGEEITQRDLCIIKYLYYKKDCVDLAVRQKSVSILAEKDGFSLSPQEEYQNKKYVCNNYEKLNLPENKINQAFKEDLIENSLNLSLYYEYITNIIIKINNGEFEYNDKKNSFKYDLFNYLNKQNDEEKLKIPYTVRIKLAENLALDYIDYKIEEYEITTEY